jgi:hypothetical protein
VPADTVATDVFEDDHVPPAGEPVRVMVLPVQTLDAPVMVGPALIVTDVVAEHPPAVYVIVAEPPLTPVTTPPVLTVAKAVFEDDHVPPAGEPVSVVVAPTHAVVVPVIVGVGLTVMVIAPALQEAPAPAVVTKTSLIATEGSEPTPSSLFVQLKPTLTFALLLHAAGKVAV